MAEKMSTSIEIVNDPRLVPYDGETLTVYVMNTGVMDLSMSDITVFTDGFPSEIKSVALIDGGGTVWQPSKIVRLSVGASLSQGDHVLKVMLDNGNYDLLEFRI